MNANNDKKRFNGKVVLVTGSGRGIGNTIAKQFFIQGAYVIFNGRSEKSLQDVHEFIETAKEIQAPREALDRIDCEIFDVSDYEEVNAAYKRIFKKYGKLDILVNNAGILKDAVVGMITKEMTEQVFATNAFGTIYNMQAAARLMIRSRQGGSIINISSIIGTNGNIGQIVYGASKAAIIGATKSAAKELAKHGIRVNAIAPGFIDTDMIKNLPHTVKEERINSIKMGRIGTTEDVASAALFLASDESNYITGQVLGVDGGMLI